MLAFKMLHNLVLVNSERTLRSGSSCKLDSPGNEATHIPFVRLASKHHVCLAAFTKGHLCLLSPLPANHGI